jgi:asparagine N-glycosylation enzyme membrane subunit Stt3
VQTGKDHRVTIGWAMTGVVLSACLALDTFALFPVSVYAWGFSGFAVVVALGLSLLPWVVWRKDHCSALPWIAPLAIGMFVVLRLPTGNLWDTLLDPWLGVGLTVYLLRQRAVQ